MVTLKRLYDMRVLLLIGTLVVLSCSCKKDFMKDDGFSLERMPYTGNQLRIDGYYYQKVNSSLFSVYFLYSNGIILSAGGVFTDKTAIDNYIREEFLETLSYKESKILWGLFAIDGANIRFERWYPSDPPLKAYVRKGEILNDTTFIITQSYRVVNGQKTDIKQREETYHFNEFSPKPDSTNRFVP